MATILDTKETDFGLEVTVDGFPHASPMFPIDTPAEELQGLVDEWAVIQFEVDSVNNGTATQEIIDKHKPQIPFNPDTVIIEEALRFSTDRIIALSPYTYTINELIRYENWTQLKQIWVSLIQGGIATQNDYDLFNSILKEQNVDLDLI